MRYLSASIVIECPQHLIDASAAYKSSNLKHDARFITTDLYALSCCDHFSNPKPRIIVDFGCQHTNGTRPHFNAFLGLVPQAKPGVHNQLGGWPMAFSFRLDITHRPRPKPGRACRRAIAQKPTKCADLNMGCEAQAHVNVYVQTRKGRLVGPATFSRNISGGKCHVTNFAQCVLPAQLAI